MKKCIFFWKHVLVFERAQILSLATTKSASICARTRVHYKLEAEANFNGVSLDYFQSARFQKQTHRVMKRQIRRLLIEDVWIARNAIISICHFKWTVHQFMSRSAPVCLADGFEHQCWLFLCICFCFLSFYGLWVKYRISTDLCSNLYSKLWVQVWMSNLHFFLLVFLFLSHSVPTLLKAGRKQAADHAPAAEKIQEPNHFRLQDSRDWIYRYVRGTVLPCIYAHVLRLEC